MPPEWLASQRTWQLAASGDAIYMRPLYVPFAILHTEPTWRHENGCTFLVHTWSLRTPHTCSKFIFMPASGCLF
jgi:hypothetical protein